MIEDPETEHVIEFAQPGAWEAKQIHDPVVDPGAQPSVDWPKGFVIDGVDCHDRRAACFRGEAEPAVPGSDIQYAAACQVGGKGKPAVPFAQSVQTDIAVDRASIFECEAMVPTLPVEFTEEILLFARQSYRFGGHVLSGYLNTNLASPALSAES